MGRRKAWLAHPFSVAILTALAAALLRALGSTWRVRVSGLDPLDATGVPLDTARDEPRIGVFWHRNILIASHLFRDRGFGVPVSQSRDGDLITALLRRLGYVEPPRGSRTRGGSSALMGVVRLVQSGTTVSIQSDGPRGPARQSKPGVIALARITGAEITPIGLSASPCIRFRSWDGTLLPLPFARVRCDYGEPISIAKDPDPASEDAACRDLDARLNAQTNALDHELGFEDVNRPSTADPAD